MTDYQFALLLGFCTKAAIMVSGVASIFFGYRLFVRGVYEGGASVKVEGWKAVVAMNKGGPGLVFALFGAIVLVVGIAHPVTAEHDQTSTKSVPAPPASGTPIAVVAVQEVVHEKAIEGRTSAVQVSTEVVHDRDEMDPPERPAR